MTKVNVHEIDDGFKWGAMELTRIGYTPSTGGVQVEIRTPKVVLNVYVTKTGMMHVVSTGKVRVTQTDVKTG